MKYLKRVLDKIDLIADDGNDVDVFLSLSCTPKKSVLIRARQANLGKKYHTMNQWRTVKTHRMGNALDSMCASTTWRLVY